MEKSKLMGNKRCWRKITYALLLRLAPLLDAKLTVCLLWPLFRYFCQVQQHMDQHPLLWEMSLYFSKLIILVGRNHLRCLAYGGTKKQFIPLLPYKWNVDVGYDFSIIKVPNSTTASLLGGTWKIQVQVTRGPWISCCDPKVALTVPLRLSCLTGLLGMGRRKSGINTAG